jgi:hypothetical protein
MRVVREPSGEWHFGIWWIRRPTRRTFSLRLGKIALVFSRA